jgi:hypothetical protein
MKGRDHDMNSKTITYHQLELIPTSAMMAQQQPWSSLQAWLVHFSRRLKAPTPHAAIPFVWRSVDTAGNDWWNVFDRLTGQTMVRLSEQQFWHWLERRYCS